MKKSSHGFALFAVLTLLAVLATMIAAFTFATRTELQSARFSRNGITGFFAAEAGLNLRAEAIRQDFVGYNRPTGPSPDPNLTPCEGGNNGQNDFQCITYPIGNRSAVTFVEEEPDNPIILTIPSGERYQNLNAQEYRYTAHSRALSGVDSTLEALLELRFKSRLVPLFQFAAFYNKDLEILPGPAMTLSGPVHTNGDLYLYSDGGSLDISGQVTTAGSLYRGRKNNNTCSNSPVRIMDPTNPRSLLPSCPTRTLISASSLGPWNGMIQVEVPAVTVPEPEVFDPTPGQLYWDRADLRLVLKLNNDESVNGVEVRNIDNSLNAAATSIILNQNPMYNCPGVASGGRVAATTTIHNFREAATMRLLDVDVRGLLTCLNTSNWYLTGKQLNDDTEGGLVFFLTVEGPNSNVQNNYAVRLRNGANLAANVAAPTVRGMTVVSDQKVYIWGNYNSTNKKPAAVMADTIDLLSNAWNDANSALAIDCGLNRRCASETTYNTAFLAATDTTGGIDGPGGQGGAYNGGLENYPRLHERWTNVWMHYRGSFVSLGTPDHSNGPWSSQSYNPPRRDWNYDTSFNNAANLPPITPRFVYLRQELFVRDFEK